MRQFTQHSPKLPRQLLEELGAQARDYDGRKRKKNVGVAERKEQRKAARKQKKSGNVSKAKHLNLTRNVPSDIEDEGNEASILKEQPNISAAPPQPKAPKSILKRPKSASSGKEIISKVQSLSPSPSPQRKVSRAVQDRFARDDAEIAALEKALGVKGKQKLPKSFEDDGLNSLLEGVDEKNRIEDKESTQEKRSEEKQWLEMKRLRAESGINEGSSTGEATEDNTDSSEDEMQSPFENEGTVEQGTELDEFHDLDLRSDQTGRPVQANPRKRKRENPYVAPVTDDSVKYVPPSLRKKEHSQSEDLSHLTRQLQGLLNRLSEANLLSILSDIEKLYRDYPRQHISTTLLDLLMGLLVDPTILSDTFIILHAGFLAAVYKVIGTDFGAQVIQRINEEFEQNYVSESSSGAGKKLTNLIALLTELYNFQVISGNLIFDFIRLCLRDFSETNTELLLRIIRSAGPQLRQDDPSSLKDIVLQLQSSVADTSEENLSVRTKFMIESINQLKNNRTKRTNVNSSIIAEHTVRMKKTLGSMNSRDLKAGEPLRISIKDLRNRDKVGSWWLMGANYQGQGQELTNLDEPTQQKQVDLLGDSQMDNTATDLVQLAKDQRMNTDVRRSIFVAIMSSSDHNDAYIRLMKLRLKRSQEFEITKVLIHCASAEKTYNPFYTFLSRRLCSDKKLKKSFQFSLWDLFKQMGERDDESEEDERDEGNGKLELRSLVNLAKMFGVIVAEGGLGLEVLKNLSLAYLQAQTQMFLEIFFVTVILHCHSTSKDARNEKVLLPIFLQPKEMPSIARGLQYFLKKVVRKTDLAGSRYEKDTVQWACNTVCDGLSDVAIEVVDED